MSKVATAVKESEIHEDREIQVKPAMVQIDTEGFITRQIVVHMPAGAVADDLRDPAIWKLVQGNRQAALRKLDHLLIFGADESWYCTAIVSVAKADSAKLVIGKVSGFQSASEGLFNDGTYRVAFEGIGYVVERIRDGARMGHAHSSEALAVDAIRRLHPQVVS
ncbi:hypothetical protein [Sinorhizobium fredii]|uniref:hypothetical protein n=1 Tax=Rhizobium fredii TaxID=380 RepID=UPI0030B1D2AE